MEGKEVDQNEGSWKVEILHDISDSPYSSDSKWKMTFTLYESSWKVETLHPDLSHETQDIQDIKTRSRAIKENAPPTSGNI